MKEGRKGEGDWRKKGGERQKKEIRTEGKKIGEGPEQGEEESEWRSRKKGWGTRPQIPDSPPLRMFGLSLPGTPSVYFCSWTFS